MFMSLADSDPAQQATALSQIGQVKSPDRRLPRSHPQKPDALGMNELPEPVSLSQVLRSW